MTTPQTPEAVHDIIAKTGPVWQVEANGDLGGNFYIAMNEEPDDANRAAMLTGESSSFSAGGLASIYSKLSTDGRGAITQVGTTGKLLLSVSDRRSELIVEPDFDNTQVVSAKRLPDSDKTEMLDAAGKKATVCIADVTLNEGTPLLTFQVEGNKLLTQHVTGIVTDAAEKPLSDVRIGFAFRNNQASGTLDASTRTAADGHFSLDVDLWPRENEQPYTLIGVVTKDGYSALDTPAIPIYRESDGIEFGTIVLNTGYCVPVRVVGKTGAPAAGAVIMPRNDFTLPSLNEFALRRQATRADADGKVTFRRMSHNFSDLSPR